MDPIENKNSTVTIKDKLFEIQWKANVKLEKEDLRLVVEQYDEITNGETWKVLHLFPKGTTVSSEARNYAAEREKPAAAEAFVIVGMIQRNLFRFYRRFRIIDYPMREFSKKQDAEDWLKNY